MKPFLLPASLAVAIFAMGCSTSKLQKTTATEKPVDAVKLATEPKITKDDRVLVFAPHPDDETIACGGVIQQARAVGAPVRIVWLTNGDNNELSFIEYRHHLTFMPKAIRAMGEVRHKEGVAATTTLGVDPKELAFLGYPDFETLTIWYKHWGSEPPLESMLTKVTKVPYADGFRPGAPYKGEDILRDIETNLREFKPTKVFVSHPSDHNVDHQSLYLFVRVALWDLQKEMNPTVYPYLVHFAKWPMPQGLKTNLAMTPPVELVGPINWGIVPVSQTETDLKDKALHCHKSQFEASPAYLESFVRANELFGDFAPVDLALTGSRSVPGEDQLTQEERAEFVGIERVKTWVEGTNLVMNVRFSKALGREAGASFFAFGYRDDERFEKMPKLRVNFGDLGHAVYDQNHKLPRKTVQYKRDGRDLTVWIPLQALGNPQRVLATVHTYLGMDPLDWAEWRILEIGK
jgi:LmbE family N-acetylglucosaminyl deacetylase